MPKKDDLNTSAESAASAEGKGTSRTAKKASTAKKKSTATTGKKSAEAKTKKKATVKTQGAKKKKATKKVASTAETAAKAKAEPKKATAKKKAAKKKATTAPEKDTKAETKKAAAKKATAKAATAKKATEVKATAKKKAAKKKAAPTAEKDAKAKTKKAAAKKAPTKAKPKKASSKQKAVTSDESTSIESKLRDKYSRRAPVNLPAYGVVDLRGSDKTAPKAEPAAESRRPRRVDTMSDAPQERRRPKQKTSVDKPPAPVPVAETRPPKNATAPKPNTREKDEAKAKKSTPKEEKRINVPPKEARSTAPKTTKTPTSVSEVDAPTSATLPPPQLDPPEPQRRRRKPAYRPQWLESAPENSAESTPEPAESKRSRYVPPPAPSSSATPPAPSTREEAPRKRRYVPPPPPSLEVSQVTVSILISSSNDAPVTAALLETLSKRPAPKQSEIIVARSERLESASNALKQHNSVRVITLQEAALVARSSLDQAAREAKGELLVILSPALTMSSDIVERLSKPMLEQPRVVAVVGTVVPSSDLTSYEALRFEQLEKEPLDLIGVRRSTWEQFTFHGSGGLGSRWLERAESAGEILRPDGATASGRLAIDGSFRDIVRDTFCNLPESPMNSLKSGLRDVVKDWDGIRRQGIAKPGPVIREAARVRLAESIGRTRLKLFFGTQRTKTSVD